MIPLKKSGILAESLEGRKCFPATLPNISNVGTLRAARGRTPRRRGVAQSGSAPALGAGCRGFESLHPDHISSDRPQGRCMPSG
jgi:hypothetical protein